jgi:hypothetical protein
MNEEMHGLRAEYDFASIGDVVRRKYVANAVDLGRMLSARYLPILYYSLLSRHRPRSLDCFLRFSGISPSVDVSIQQFLIVGENLYCYAQEERIGVC